jgi:hypothetical protein
VKSIVIRSGVGSGKEDSSLYSLLFLVVFSLLSSILSPDLADYDLQLEASLYLLLY